jgi:hypothetical protein
MLFRLSSEIESMRFIWSAISLEALSAPRLAQGHGPNTNGLEFVSPARGSR